MKIHEIIGENRIKFAARLLEMSEELTLLVKEVDKNRKGVRVSLYALMARWPDNHFRQSDQGPAYSI
jgi:hypothetical protein